MRKAPAIVALTAAVTAGLAWPWFVATHSARATAVQTAPVNADYRLRDRRIAFYEREARRDPQDQIVLAALAGEHLQRFRETGDISDATRARALGQRSLQIQHAGNVAALNVLASADLAFHNFDEAQRVEEEAIEALPFDDGARAQLASILMERGGYGQADRILLRPRDVTPSITWLAVRARYNELTGNLTGARVELERATARADRMLSISAYARSWFHMRSGQLAFESGDDAAAEAEFNEALRIFPESAAAHFGLAKLYRGRRDWNRTLPEAVRSAQLYPLPATLAFQADAQRELGQDLQAAQTDALIDAERRLFNTQGVNDREIALYYAQRHTHLDDALRMARADLVKRGDEIYADDTMAWVLAATGRWNDAYVYAERAVRLQTEDSMLHYHAGVIAMESGRPTEARTRLSRALALNPNFDAFYAEDARHRLDELSATALSLR